MIPLLFEDVKFGALQQRRAGAKEGAQKINSKCWNSQFADKFNYFAWASSIHKILTTKRAYSSSSTEANKQAYKQLSVLPFYHIFPFHRIQILNWTKPNEHHTFICYFVKMKNERSSGERRVCTIRHLSLLKWWYWTVKFKYNRILHNFAESNSLNWTFFYELFWWQWVSLMEKKTAVKMCVNE